MTLKGKKINLVGMLQSARQKFIFDSILRFLLMAPFNLLLIALPSLILLALLLTTWMIVFALFSFSFASPVIAVQTELISLSAWMLLAFASTSFFSFCAAISLSFILFYISKKFLIFMLEYIYWNWRFVLQKPASLT